MLRRMQSTMDGGFMVLVFLMTIVGCASQAEPPGSGTESFIFVGDSASGTLSVIEHGSKGNTVAETMILGAGSIADIVLTTEDHIFASVTNNNAVAAIDPMADELPALRNFLSAGSRPVHLFLDPDGTRIWVMNDGDATSGDCKTSGPGGTATNSVTVIQNHDVGGGGGAGLLGEVIATICVGRGHHKAAFSYPSTDQPGVPDQVFVSNITDGTVSVIDNDPTSPDYHTVIDTVDLCDPARNTGGCDADLTTPDGAVPHGIDYSPVSGKIYNANVGYGTVTVIDPLTNSVDSVIDTGFSDRTHVTHDGRLIVVLGTDETSDTDHVIGKISIIDVATDSLANQMDLTDVHPDNFELTPDGNKLYVTSATAGSGTQLDNLKNDVLLVYDASALPALTLIAEVTVGVADGEHRALAIHEHDGEAEHVFVPNPAEGTVSVVDAETDTVVDEIDVGGAPSAIKVFPMEGGHTH